MTPRAILACCLGGAVAAGCAALTGPGKTSATQALPQLAQALLDAVPANPAVWREHMSERGVFVSESGDTASRAELLEAFVPFPPGLSGRIELRNPQISEFGEVAVMVFDAHEQQAVFDQRIEVDYKVVQTWRHEDGRWQLLANQNLVRARDPAPVPVSRSRLARYVGIYELGSWRYQVELREGQLYGGRQGAHAKAPLIAVGENVFADGGSSLGVLRIFLPGAGGAVERMVQRRKFADTHWRRIAP